VGGGRRAPAAGRRRAILVWPTTNTLIAAATPCWGWGPAAGGGGARLFTPSARGVLGWSCVMRNQPHHRYFNDLWELDLTELTWRAVGPPTGAAAAAPCPRSGVGLAVSGDALYVYGGYSKEGDADDEELEHGRAHDDMWALDLTQYTVRRGAARRGPRPRRLGARGQRPTSSPAAEGPRRLQAPRARARRRAERGRRRPVSCLRQRWGCPSRAPGGLPLVRPPACPPRAPGAAHPRHAPPPSPPLPGLASSPPPQWERVKKAGMAPGPRASFGWAVHKGTRAFLFGGVSDNEAKGGEDLSSEFHNDLYTFSCGNRWAWLESLRRSSRAAAGAVAVAGPGFGI
jgi:hypothetical protein